MRANDDVGTAQDDHVNDFEFRVAQLNAMIAAGINPYPESAYLTHSNAAALSEPEGTSVTVGGRIMKIREHGNFVFMDIRDDSDTGPLPIAEFGSKKGQLDYSKRGRLQIVINLQQTQNTELLQYLGVSDFISVVGERYQTKKGEQSVLAHSLTITSKALRQHPDVLEDENIRYRLRSVDMVTNPEIAEIFRNRATIVKSVRRTLEDVYNFIEIDTPILQMVYGGANAKPFTTHVNALNEQAFLSISPELKLKLAMMGNLERVYAIARNFRNEGIDRSHNPEFSMTELYHANWTADDVMALLEDVYKRACVAVHGRATFTFQGIEVDLSKPWRRLKMRDGIREYLNLDVDSMSDEELKQAISEHGETYTGKWVRGLGIAKLFGAVEKNLLQPTFVVEYPIETTSLCKEDPEHPGWIMRSEPYMCGIEIGNLYSEQNNPLVQRAAWEAEREYEDKHPMDEQFLLNMEYGMPNAGGLGFGIDRMVMLLLDQPKLREVIFEPLMKPLADIAELAPDALPES